MVSVRIAMAVKKDPNPTKRTNANGLRPKNHQHSSSGHSQTIHYLLARKMRKQLQSRYQKESRKCDAIENTEDRYQRKHHAGEESGVLLQEKQTSAGVLGARHWKLISDLIIDDALNQHKTPGHQQGLEGVGERVRLIRPCDIGGGHQHHCGHAVPRRRNQFVDRPVLEHEAQHKHPPS